MRRPGRDSAPFVVVTKGAELTSSAGQRLSMPT